MTLCFKAVVNMEDKHPLNFHVDKFHLCAKLLLSCPYYLTTQQLAWTNLLSINPFAINLHLFSY